MPRFIWILVAFALGASVEPAEPRLAASGDRGGYDSSGDARNIEALRGEAAGLLDLIRQPPLGLPMLPLRDPVEPAALELGRRLFADRRLSVDGTLSCATCHVPEQGFTRNGLALSVGIEGRMGKRNAPALYNVGYRTSLFHDGRETSLELQIWGPLLARNEMGNPSMSSVLERLAATDDYAAAFEAAFAEGLSVSTLGRALASYERALLSGASPFDRWFYGGLTEALSATAKRGFSLFVKHNCATCHLIEHQYAHFTDEAFHDTGIGYRAALSRDQPTRIQVAPGLVMDIDADNQTPNRGDLGRYEATGKLPDRWKYRTPPLRNVALTPPYMHNGSLATLSDVVDFYASGGVPHEGQDPRIRPLALTSSDRASLISFLESLTGDNVDALAGDARAPND